MLGRRRGVAGGWRVTAEPRRDPRLGQCNALAYRQPRRQHRPNRTHYRCQLDPNSQQPPHEHQNSPTTRRHHTHHPDMSSAGTGTTLSTPRKNRLIPFRLLTSLARSPGSLVRIRSPVCATRNDRRVDRIRGFDDPIEHEGTHAELSDTFRPSSCSALAMSSTVSAAALTLSSAINDAGIRREGAAASSRQSRWQSLRLPPRPPPRAVAHAELDDPA